MNSTFSGFAFSKLFVHQLFSDWTIDYAFFTFWKLKLFIPNICKKTDSFYFLIYNNFHVFLGVLNSFVHCVMYSYYFITSYNPNLKKSLWWKKYITQIQLIQFVMLFSYCIISILFVECENPKVFLWFGVVQSVIMMTMFSDFYYKAYIKKKPSTWWTYDSEQPLFGMLKLKQNVLKILNSFYEFVILFITFST